MLWFLYYFVKLFCFCLFWIVDVLSWILFVGLIAVWSYVCCFVDCFVVVILMMILLCCCSLLCVRLLILNWRNLIVIGWNCVGFESLLDLWLDWRRLLWFFVLYFNCGVLCLVVFVCCLCFVFYILILILLCLVLDWCVVCFLDFDVSCCCIW